jgi:hypothetical protein
MKMRLLFLTFLFTLGCLGIYPRVAAAHGGGALQLANEPAGPYLLTVWTSPPVAQAGRPLHVTVAVTTAESESPVLDAQVLVSLLPLETNNSPLSAPATTAQSVNKLFYETDFTVANIGRYQLTLHVAGMKGEGESAFVIDVRPATNVNWLSLGLIVFGLIVVVALWRSWESQAENRPGSRSLQPKRRKSTPID